MRMGDVLWWLCNHTCLPSLWLLLLRISCSLFPDAQSILHCSCFYPPLSWKRWTFLIHCSSLATASSSLTHSLPSFLSPLASKLSLPLSLHNPSSMCASPPLLLLCCAAHIRSPPSLPVLLSPSAVSSGTCLSHLSGFALMAQGGADTLFFSAHESCR